MSKKIGRFEYVKRGLVGVCAATMLAGMCAVPAFATDGDTKVDSTGTMSTSVAVDTSAIGQINVTVPTAPLSGSADANGKLTFANNYKFTNNSPLSITVTGAKVTVKDSVNLVASTAKDGENAINIMAKIGTVDVDLANYTTDGVAVDGVAAIAKDAEGTIGFSGTISNVTKLGVDDNLAVADIVWTLATV